MMTLYKLGDRVKITVLSMRAERIEIPHVTPPPEFYDVGIGNVVEIIKPVTSAGQRFYRIDTNDTDLNSYRTALGSLWISADAMELIQ